MVYRLSFDFPGPDEMVEFWEQFQDINRLPSDEDSWDSCEIVHEDTLHAKKGLKKFLIREKSDSGANGRPAVIIRSPSKVEIK